MPNGWGSYLNEMPALDRGYHRINRTDLLNGDGLPQTLLAGYVWGTGSSAFLVGRRARVFRDNDAARIADCLQGVAEELRKGNTVEAYGSMLRETRTTSSISDHRSSQSSFTRPTPKAPSPAGP
ncbi:hypothetical protein I549_4114 [Mycobacterium avium subsp. avium 2285 (R)]|nr:hypothetical protein I549_4114 [Mycobacterium avium subsp. avium 2285 (R)]